MNTEKFKPAFFDKYGNLKANSNQATSENPSTINAVFALMLDKLAVHEKEYGTGNEYRKALESFDIGLLNYQKHAMNGGIYLTMEGDYEKYIRQIEGAPFWKKPFMALNLHKHKFVYKAINVDRSPKRFSHDETNGVVCTSYYFKDHNRPGFGNVDPTHKMNLDKIQWPTEQTIYRFYDLGMAIDYARTQDPGNLKYIRYFSVKACKAPIGETSGKQQAFIRTVGLRLRDIFLECTDALPEHNGWEGVFSIYYPQASHPINICCREMVKRGLL